METPVPVPTPSSQPNQAATAPGKPRSTRTQIGLVIGAVIGLMLAVVLIRAANPTRMMARSLHQGDDAARREAATSLSAVDAVDFEIAIPAVAQAMINDPSPEVRCEATRTMGTLGGESIKRLETAHRDQALGATLATLDDKDPTVRQAALTVIPMFANAAINLSGNEYDVRGVGAPKAVVAKLLPLLNDPNESVQKFAATALGYFPIELDPSLPMLFKAAATEAPPANSRGRGVMAGVLAKVRPLKPSVPFLIESLKSPDPKTRYLATITLGQASTDAVDAVPDLIKILTDSAGSDERDDPGRAAATSLGDIAPGTPRAAEALAALQEAKSAASRGRERAITTALRKFEPAAP